SSAHVAQRRKYSVTAFHVQAGAARTVYITRLGWDANKILRLALASLVVRAEAPDLPSRARQNDTDHLQIIVGKCPRSGFASESRLPPLVRSPDLLHYCFRLSRNAIELCPDHGLSLFRSGRQAVC